MNKKLKNLIDNAIQFVPNEMENKLEFDFIYLINTGKLYTGFWNKNGYNNMICIGCVAGKNKSDDVYYRINNSQYDVIQFNVNSVMIDVPHDLNCIRLFGRKFVVSSSTVSCLMVKAVNANYE